MFLLGRLSTMTLVPSAVLDDRLKGEGGGAVGRKNSNLWWHLHQNASRKTNQNLPLSVKSYHLGCWFTLIGEKRTMKTATLESGSRSVHFKNSTTSHLSFSLCKEQKRFKTGKIRIRHVIFILSCIKPYTTIMRLLVLCCIHLIRFQRGKRIGVKAVI